MATTDLQTFIEDRLRSLDPTIDLNPGSPAQMQFVTPLLNYLGTDPFETDIQTFILDRMAQEYPDIFTGDPGVVRDTLVKPLILMLEPFKRETQLIKNNQSLRDASVLSDDDADALVANFFETRSAGGFSSGIARVYYSNPVNVTVEVTTRFFNAAGLNFYPANPSAISAEEMVFNREGSLYFLDVSVQAEATGADYNLAPNSLSGVTGLYGVLKVNNPQKFSNGSPVIDTPTFVANARAALNERSMVTRRGATARLAELFQTTVRATQIIGAGDPEMQRDILVATSPGHAWMTGPVVIYKNIALVQCRTLDAGVTTATPVVGDELYIYLDRYSRAATWATTQQSQRFIRLPIVEILAGPMNASSPFQSMFFVRFSDVNNVLTTMGVYPFPGVQQFEGGLSKKGTIQISSLPSVGAVNLEANNQEVHVFGHSDIYARPILQSVSTTVIDTLTDDPGSKYFTIQSHALATTAASNALQDTTVNFVTSGVAQGDIVSIETGSNAGTFTVLSVVSSDTLAVNSNMSATETGIRYRVSKGVHINPFEPKIPKVPFGANPNNDLQTAIGSATFTFNGGTTDLVSYGVKVGDTLRVASGVDAGDFTVSGIIDGKHLTMNRAAGGSNSNLSYSVFTPLSKVQTPLVRINQLMVLDSSSQATGVEIPYAEPVAVVPSCDFTTAQVRGQSVRKTGFVLPQLNNGVLNFVSGGNVASFGIPASKRYSDGVDPVAAGDIYKHVIFPDATHDELLFLADASTDGCSYFVASAEGDSLATNYPPIDPKVGDALTLKSGPNKGSYLIQKVVKFKYKLAGGEDSWLYFIKIYGTFPVDILRQVIEFCTGAGGAAVVPLVDVTRTYPLAFPNFFQDTYNLLGTYLDTALTATYFVTSPGVAALQMAVDAVALSDYEWGDPARGVLRSYFATPTLFQQHTATNLNPTTYSFKSPTGEVLKFRTDPNLYPHSQLVPARLGSDTPITGLPRDIIGGSSSPVFTSGTRPTMLQVGVHVGDTLSVSPETFFHGSDGTTSVSTDRQTAVRTTEGSNDIVSPGALFTPSMTGGVVIIDESDDAGAYTITSVPNSSTLRLDRPLTLTTPSVVASGNAAAWGLSGPNNIVYSVGAFNVTMIGQWVTIFGVDSRYQGSYLIANATTDTLTVTRPVAIGNFTGYPSTPTAWFVVTDAPLVTPNNNAALKGTELTGLRPIRVYGPVPSTFPITAIPPSLAASTVTVTGTVPHGVLQPFQVYRSNVRRVTPTEMSTKVDGPLFYFDSEAVSLGAEEGYNLPEWTSYLTADMGTYESVGYRHVVDDSTLSYSPRETGILELPASVLPLNTPDSLDNMLSLTGVPIQISYEYGDVIQQIQDFISSTEDRVTAANMLARHFLPTYVSYDATYTGGSAPSVIAKDIISYIDNLGIEASVDVSMIEDLIANRGGNVDTPTKVIVTLHDWDRKMWVEFSQDALGGTVTNVPYNGSTRVSYFIPGRDASGQVGTTGERILLTQR